MLSRSSKSSKYLLSAILGFFAILVIFQVASVLNQEQYPIHENLYPTDILFIILPGTVVLLGIYLSIKNRFKGNHGKAWIFFTLAIASWFTGEVTYSYTGEIDFDNISTLTSDIFYLSGYPLFFIFTIFYLRPRKRIISKKIIVSASMVSLIVVFPTLYLSIGIYDELSLFENILYGAYPILDGVILIPSIIAVGLFFRGQVNLFWSLLFFGVFVLIIADTVYLMLEMENSYEIGSFVDVLFLWSYVFYALAVWGYIRMYRDAKNTINLQSK